MFPEKKGRLYMDAGLHHMQGLKLAECLDRDCLAAELAATTAGFTGADIAYTCQRAALLCVKEASTAPDQCSALAITVHHFRAALASHGSAPAADHTDVASASAVLLARAMN